MTAWIYMKLYALSRTTRYVYSFITGRIASHVIADKPRVIYREVFRATYRKKTMRWVDKWFTIP